MNLFSISSLILCLSSIAFSFIIYRTDRTNKINKSWFYSCISFSLWALGLTGVTLSKMESSAIFWQYLLDVSAIFLPFFYLVFIFNLLKLKKISIIYLFALIASGLALFSFTPLFKHGVTVLYGFYWIKPGEYYIVFPAYFLSVAVITLGLLIRQYFIYKKDSLLRSQIRNTLIAGIIGYTGGLTNFFPQLFSIYPYGNYLVILYIVFMVYGVLKYKLLSTKVISAQIFSTALILVSLFNLLKSEQINDWLLNFLILLLISVFSYFLINSVNEEVRAREKIEKLATDLKVANTRLVELDKQKSEFVSFATHQLRAPLTAMKGYTSLMLENEMGTLSAEVRTAISRIYESAKTLTSIVDDYLNISRIELGTMKYAFSVLDLKVMVSNVIGELKPNIEKSGLVTSFSTSPSGESERFMVRADQDKLKQVIANLIDNSIKYTPQGSLNISLIKDTDKRIITFKIKDTGVGIAPEVMPKLFSKFVRADNANKQNIYGTGLGLFVAKEIVLAHHGKIWAESEGDGKGSCFYVELEMSV